MQFENQLLAQVLSTIPQQMRWAQSDVSVGGGVCLCVGERCMCLSLCVWIELLFPTGLRFALSFSANHFNVIFYIISLIYQPLCLAPSLFPSLCPSLSFSSPLSLPFSLLLFPSPFPHSFVCANPLLTCKFIQLSWFSTLEPPPPPPPHSSLPTSLCYHRVLRHRP